EDLTQQPNRAILVERLVPVATFRRLDAGWASALTPARRDRLHGRAQVLCAGFEATRGKPGASRVSVVDEDGAHPGIRVHRGRDPADVPAVAHGEQRHEADRGVLGRVHSAGYRRRIETGGGEQA